MRSTKFHFLLLMLPCIFWHSVSASLYSSRYGFLCIRPDYLTTVWNTRSETECGTLCSRDQRCQAFSLADGPCQLFVFDKCSKSVRDCGCSRRGQVFVKQQPGLEEGALCPSGYGMDLCGVKYKVVTTTGTWTEQRQRCESDSGLVIMADVTSSAEMAHVGVIYSEYNPTSGLAMWDGGLQTPGSAEPLGGWHWVSCNITVNGSFWGGSELSNSPENAIFTRTLLGDHLQTNPTLAGLCECLSPFD